MGLGNTKYCPVLPTACDLLGIKLKVAPSNGLVGDMFTRNVMVGCAHRWTDRRTIDNLWYEINIPFLLKKRSGIIRVKCFRAT